MGGTGKQSGMKASGRSGVFSITIATSPPPSPSMPPAPSPAPNAPFELPIIKAFKSQFGLDDQTLQSVSGMGTPYSTLSTTSGAGGAYGDKANCEYVCRVYNAVGAGRRLLFGGLQFGGASEVVGCTPDQV